MLRHSNKNKCTIDTAEKLVATNTWFSATILENIPESILVTDSRELIIYCNKEIIRLFGYTADEAVGKNMVSLFAPDPFA